MAEREYRVRWRREHDKRLRTRLYQTRAGAENFVSFLERPDDEHYPQKGSILGDNLATLGGPVDVVIESRSVGLWAR